MDNIRTPSCHSERIRIFKVGQQTSTLTNQQAIPTASFYTGTNRKSGHTHTDVTNKLSCAYCKGTHSANHCDASKDIPLHLEVIKKNIFTLTALLIAMCPSAPQKTAPPHAVKNTTQVIATSITRQPVAQNTPPTRKVQIRSARTVFHLQPLIY